MIVGDPPLTSYLIALIEYCDFVVPGVLAVHVVPASYLIALIEYCDL